MLLNRDLTIKLMAMLISSMAIFILLTACNSIYSIKADDSFVASREGADLMTNVVTTEFENPVMTGLITVPGVRIESGEAGTTTSCCRRLQMHANQNVFASPFLIKFDTAFLNITGRLEGSNSIFNYGIPAISMPTDGSEVRFALFDDSERVAGSVRLSEQVIVLPVHVHVFTEEDRRVDPRIKRDQVFAWFERPAFTTRAEIIHNASTGITETHLIKTPILQPLQIYSNVDDIFHQALIQFRLESYNTIVNPEMERQIITNNLREFVPSGIHARFRDIPGIHIYIGRTHDNVNLAFGSQRIAITLGPGESCDSTVNKNNAIALAWDDVRNGDRPNVLAHELGHYLGLGHTNSELNLLCGVDLLNSPGDRNLMEIGAGDSSISARQAELARSFACMYLRLWGMTSRACS
jgi:hypothetical protein